jgi:glycosyltransferase involved in cell wall biosynthesis
MEDAGSMNSAETLAHQRTEISPDVDVLLPVMFPAPWLSATLSGIEHQRNVHVHLVLVVHGETAELTGLLAQYSGDFTAVQVPIEESFSHVLNTGLAYCRTDFVARCDSDDIPSNDRFFKQLNYLLENQHVSAVSSDATLIDENDQVLGTRTTPPTPGAIRRRMRWKTAIIHPSVMFRKNIIEGLGAYSLEAKSVEDYDLWLRLLAVSEIGHLSEPLLEYRIHKNQVSQSRATNNAGIRQIKTSRLNLAIASGESVFMAKIRQAIWAMRQYPRVLIRKDP